MSMKMVTFKTMACQIQINVDSNNKDDLSTCTNETVDNGAAENSPETRVSDYTENIA